VNLRLLARRNFGLGTASNFLLGFALYGSAYLLPQYLANSQGLNAQQTGQIMAWTGVPQLFIIPLVPLVLMRFIDSRLIVGTGLAIFALSCFMNIHLSPNYAGPQLFVPDVTRAFGQALVMAPLSGIAMVGITAQEAGTASGLFNMLRNLGGAIGVATIETFTTKREQYHSFVINSRVSTFEPATRERLDTLQQYFMSHGTTDPESAMHRAVVAVGKIIRSQAMLMGYADAFALVGVVLVVAVISVALLKKGIAEGAAAH
jgi:DHA2 family multidrug resistance protein